MRSASKVSRGLPACKHLYFAVVPVVPQLEACAEHPTAGSVTSPRLDRRNAIALLVSRRLAHLFTGRGREYDGTHTTQMYQESARPAGVRRTQRARTATASKTASGAVLALTDRLSQIPSFCLECCRRPTRCGQRGIASLGKTDHRRPSAAVRVPGE